MLIKQPKINIISKVITLPNGSLAQAFFAVINIEGVISVKFLCTKTIEEKEQILIETSEFFESTRTEKKYKPYTISPFFNLDLLINQLARAPSFK